MTVRLRRGGIPLHKLTLEKVIVGSVSRRLQDLENDVSVHLTQASGAGIGGPADVRGPHGVGITAWSTRMGGGWCNEITGNHNQAGKVGDQVPGNLWHRAECKAGPSQRRRTRWVH